MVRPLLLLPPPLPSVNNVAPEPAPNTKLPAACGTSPPAAGVLVGAWLGSMGVLEPPVGNSREASRQTNNGVGV